MSKDSPIVGWLLIGWFVITGSVSLLMVPTVFKVMAQSSQPTTTYQYEIELNQTETNDCRFLTIGCSR